eukprot:COSAG02_NODE_5256_length_4493_cov_3.387119_4_plen_63_part_00
MPYINAMVGSRQQSAPFSPIAIAHSIVRDFFNKSARTSKPAIILDTIESKILETKCYHTSRV